MKLRAIALIAGAAVLVALIAPATASAHGLGGIRDLPIPGWLFLFGGATVLIVSFLALGVLWREPRLDASAGTPLPAWMQWVVFAPVVRVAVRTLSLLIFVLVWSAAAFGTDRPSQNLAPTFIYVLFWIGITVASVIFGNVWSVLDPWRTVADVVAWLSARIGVRRTVSAYPLWLGIWPAVLLLGLLHGARARLPRPGEAAGPGVRDPSVQRRHMVGNGGLRPPGLGLER